MSRMQPGQLRFKAEFKANAPTNNGRGMPVDSLTTTAKTLGALEEISGYDHRVGPAFLGVQTHWYRCRYVAGVTTTHKAVIRGVTYTILAPPRVPDGDRRSGFMEVRLQKVST